MPRRLRLPLLVSLAVLPGLASAQPFHVAPVYPAPTPLRSSLVAGDLNRDGWPDLVGSDYDQHLTVFLNDGTGRFGAPSILTAGSRLVGVAIADFNSDSMQDLIAADEGGLWLFLGDGSGGFAPAVSVGSGSDWVAAADLNGDGHADLLTGFSYAGWVTLMASLGDGAGHFAPPMVVLSATYANGWPKLADFNADGTPDLALPGGLGVWVLLGDGAGGFGPAVLHLAGGYDTTDLATGDFNNDGKGDLVAATSQGLYFFPGDGAGDFGLTVQSPAVILSSLTAGDFNEDGNRDLGGTTSLGEGAVLGDGAGHFNTASAYIDGVGGVPYLAVDVDRDSHLDIVAAGEGIAVLRGDGAAHFDALESFSIPTSLGTPQLAVADFNEDGKADLGVANPIDPSLVLLGDGQGGFSAAGSVAGCPSIEAASVGDFDGDTHLDLVALGRQTQTPTQYAVCVFLGDGAGGLATPVTTPISWVAFAVADFNEDGRDDVVVSTGPGDTVSVLLSTGLGAFAPPVDYLMSSDPGAVAVGDWNGDGHADVASFGDISQDLSVRLGDGLGGLGARTRIPIGTFASTMIVGDWNGDNRFDLALESSLGGLVLLGDGTGQFVPGGSFPPGAGMVAPPVAGDFDADGRLDIASFNGGNFQLGVPPAMLVSPGDGLGGFGSPWAFFGVPMGVSAVSADFNSDGRPDIVVGSTGAIWPFLSLAADLTVSIDDGQTTAVPGTSVSYVVTMTNLGPRAVPGAKLTPTLPGILHSPSFTPSAGAYDPATGLWTGLDVVAGASVTLTITGTLDAGATGGLSVSASVAAPSGFGDPNGANNAASDVDLLTPEADLSVHLSDLGDPASPGAVVVYEAQVESAGPSVAPDASFGFDVPPGATFLSSTPGAPACVENAGVVNCTVPSLAPGQSATFVVSAAVGGVGVVAATAVVAGGTTPDPDLGNNLAAEATTILVGMRRELVRGSTLVSGVDAAEGLFGYPGRGFRVRMPPRSSWEVVVDGVTGDLGGAAGPILQWVDDENGVHASGPAGVAFSRSLRIENPGPDPGEGYVHVVSTACVLNCGPDDVFRISARETTLFGARFNNSATQTTVIVLQNSSAQVVSGHLDFHDASGAWLHGEPITLGPHQSLALGPSGIPAIQGQAGSVSFSHDGRLGAVSGKASAVEPATGLTFDTPLATHDH